MHSPTASPTASAATSAAAVTEADLRRLVHTFYARVRQDPLLAPLFESHVDDWDAHLETLVDFWLWLVLKKEGFDGSPMPKHARLPGLGWAHFERWLELFHRTTGELQVPALKNTVDAMARRMASTLWQNYQKHNPASAWLRDMPAGLSSYKLSPVFTPANLPAAFKAAHSIKAGTWGLLRVHSGALVFTLDVQPPRTLLLDAGEQLVVEPQVPHHVTFVAEGAFQIDFHR